MTQHNRLLNQIRRIALLGLGERQTDGQLLEHFITQRDEAAFALLLRRHGAMVWSVCRRVLGNPHDADDAFQAAFLVLVRKADSIRPRDAVGNWLYGVAYRTSLEARKRLARRRAKEQVLEDVPSPDNEESWPDFWPILDRELSRLADKYRLPIVLCDLEGRSRKDVARQLAIPEGTLSSRLDTARKKLAVRLARYGFAVSALSLGTLLMERTATASLSFTLLSATTKAAMLTAAGPAVVAGAVSATVSTLTEGVLKAMFIAKIKTATLVLCSVAAFGVGTGGVYYQTQAGAADSPQGERVVQNNRNRNSDSGDREIDKLKRENQELREILERQRSAKAALREKLNASDDDLLKRAIRVVVTDQSDDSLQKPGSDAVSQKRQAEQEMLRKGFQEQAETLRARMQELEAQQKALEGQRKMLDKQLKELMAQRKQLEMNQRKMKESLQRQLDSDVKDKIKRGQAEKQSIYKPVEKQPASGDKLDQVLQRLERLEKRLDRLERNRD